MLKNRIVFLLFIFFLASCEKKQESTQQKSTVDTTGNKTEVVTPVPLPPEAPLLPEVIDEVPREYSFAEKLAQAALERTTHEVVYDGRYQKIAYPMGDVPDSIGVCTDVVIRSYRQLGIDLQQLVHEDIRKNFKLYPNQKRWGLSRPDTNIDHRRVPNLQVFFSRHGESLPITEESGDYLPGDLVSWKLNENMVHIGIVAEEKAYLNPERHLIIHNIGRGPELGDILFDYEITGHYQYAQDLERGL